MQIEQLLHGYNNGHHLIAGSISLPLPDTDKMSYLSDWSGYVNPIDKNTDYITAYPLEESGYYVVAKSWYADEMNRPGCVWTHSLLVKLDMLGQYSNFYELSKLFARPKREGEDFMSYTKPIELNEENIKERREPIKDIDSTRFLFMVATLLDRQKPAVYTIEKTSDIYIELCLRLIQNIPFGILKELTICSGSATVRKINKGFYNLQFVTGKGELLVEAFPENVRKPLADKGFQFWMDAVLSGRSDVSQMIHRFSADIGNDSNKMLAVTNLLKLLNDRISGLMETATITDVLTCLTSAFTTKDSGKTIKIDYLREPVSTLFCDEKTFILKLATTKKADLLDYEAIGYMSRVEAFRKAHTMEEYFSLLVELSKADYLNKEGKGLLANALEGLTKDAVVVLLKQDWSLFKSIVTLNSQILVNGFWLDLFPPQFVSLFAIFQRDIPGRFNEWEKLYKKLLIIDTFVADNILAEFAKRVENYVEIALDEWNKLSQGSINKNILEFCMNQISTVIRWMSKQPDLSDEIRLSIKKKIHPDDPIVVNIGSSAWSTFVKEELHTQNDANELVYIYVLAFNWRDYQAIEYLKQVLPYIYEALSMETFSRSSWERIEKFTGSVPFWRSWDNCRKVLIGVKKYCKDMNLKEDEIKNFSTNPKLNVELMDLWKK